MTLDNWTRAEMLSFAHFYMFLILLFDSKAHSAQWFENSLVVAGGTKEDSSAVCTVSDDTGKFDCVDITPTLNKNHYGVSIMVSSDIHYHK